MTDVQSAQITSCWFEIPSGDFERAVAFYEKSFGVGLVRENIQGNQLAIFPHEPGTAGGCVINGAAYRPGNAGTMIYLNCPPGVGIEAVIARVIRNGGRLLTPKTLLLRDLGCYAHIQDSEGNAIGLHAQA